MVSVVMDPASLASDNCAAVQSRPFKILPQRRCAYHCVGLQSSILSALLSGNIGMQRSAMRAAVTLIAVRSRFF